MHSLYILLNNKLGILVFPYVHCLSDQLNKAACLHSTFNVTKILNTS